MSNIVDFYTKLDADADGNALEEIWGWSDWAWESSHTTIQWVFPLQEPSNFNPDAPLLTEEDIKLWRVNPELQENFRISFRRFMRFLGLEWDGAELKIAENFSKRIPLVWEAFNHNWLRITRCLASLRLLGLQLEADAFYKRLESIKQSNRFPIREDTFKFWTEAVTGQPFSRRLGE